MKYIISPISKWICRGCARKRMNIIKRYEYDYATWNFGYSGDLGI